MLLVVKTSMLKLPYLMKLFSNFIPNRRKTFTDSDPPWITEDIKNKIKLTLFSQSNASRLQAAVSCLRKYHIRQRSVFKLFVLVKVML